MHSKFSKWKKDFLNILYFWTIECLIFNQILVTIYNVEPTFVLVIESPFGVLVRNRYFGLGFTSVNICNVQDRSGSKISFSPLAADSKCSYEFLLSNITFILKVPIWFECNPEYIILCFTILSYSILCSIMLCYAILCYAILFYNILQCTIHYCTKANILFILERCFSPSDFRHYLVPKVLKFL